MLPFSSAARGFGVRGPLGDSQDDSPVEEESMESAR